MIRPSLLGLAEKCGHAVQLAEDHPESSSAAEGGTTAHAEMDDHIKGKRNIEWVARMVATFPKHVAIESEQRVTLMDDDGVVLSEGTADMVLTHEDGAITVPDLKTGNPDKVAEPDDNLQLLTYGLASAIERSAPRFRVGLFFTQFPPLRLSRWIVTAEAGWIIDRVRTALGRRRDVPVVGSHCGSCFRRTHCKAWLLPVQDGEGALVPFTSPGGLTMANADKALFVVQAMEDAVKVAKARLQDFARENGGIRSNGKIWAPTLVSGRTSITASAVPPELMAQLEEAGAVSKGGKYEVFRWKTDKGGEGNKSRDTSRE